MSRDTLHRIKAGEGNPRHETLHQIAQTLGVPLPYPFNAQATPLVIPPDLLDRTRDAALLELDRIRRGNVVDADRAKFWVGEIHKVAMEILSSRPDESEPDAS